MQSPQSNEECTLCVKHTQLIFTKCDGSSNPYRYKLDILNWLPSCTPPKLIYTNIPKDIVSITNPLENNQAILFFLLKKSHVAKVIL